MSQITEGASVDLVKIDIEGAEGTVFAHDRSPTA